jgi:Bacterial protein of unknown function (Gcw_chp)
MRTIAGIACGVCVAGLLTTPARAQSAAGPSSSPPAVENTATQAAPEAPAPAKRLTFTTGVDFTSAYMFRGIRQHSGGTIAQPFADLGIALGSGVTANVGGWESIHSTAPNGNWYEADYYGSLTFTAGKLKPGVLFTSYTSPADSFATVHELAGVLGIDDSGNAFPLSPKVILAFELSDAQADGGQEKGTYLELGIRPGIKLAEKLTLVIPVKTGLSVNKYYEGPTGDNRFGFFSTGLQLSVPVVSGSGGSLEAHGGVDMLWLGDNLKLLNGDDGFKPVGIIGFTFTY